MRNILIILLLIFMITGCPGGNHEGAEIGESQWISVDEERVCFSLDRSEVLTTYNLSSNEDDHKMLMASDTRDPINAVYPNTCFNIQLKTGYIYYTFYKINDTNYHYEFFIDNNWNVVSLKGAQ